MSDYDYVTQWSRSIREKCNEFKKIRAKRINRKIVAVMHAGGDTPGGPF